MIEQVALGSTGMNVSRLGLGTVKFGRNQGVRYPEQFNLPTDMQILELLNTAQQSGINLLDTAPAYGVSEERLGKLLKGTRHHWIISTKVGEEFVNGESYFDFSPTATRCSIERSLKRLNTDVLDIVLVHSNGDDKKIIEEDAIFDVLTDIKKSGLIRSFGMSTKTIAGGMLAIDHSDVAMVTYNALQPEEKSVIEYAKHKQKAIFIKKAFASGHLVKTNPEEVSKALQFVFNQAGVTSVILGTLNPAHLLQNVECVNQL